MCVYGCREAHAHTSQSQTQTISQKSSANLLAVATLSSDWKPIISGFGTLSYCVVLHCSLQAQDNFQPFQLCGGKKEQTLITGCKINSQHLMLPQFLLCSTNRTVMTQGWPLRNGLIQSAVTNVLTVHCGNSFLIVFGNHNFSLKNY